MNDKKIAKATSWSFLTQIIAKIIPPLSNMILARLFAPEVFGAIATITMVTSFADTISESGFQKYIVSKDYKDSSELSKDSDVAFWTHLSISVLLWAIISLFREPICFVLGNPELEFAMVIACMQLPITALSSIQTAVYHREYNFRRPFVSQLISSIVTLGVTLSLAFSGIGYWAIIIGNIVGYLLRSLILSVRAVWRPHFYYSFRRLKNIFSFSMWIMVEGISVWATSWFDSFIVGNRMNSHNLGIYKNSQSVVNGVLSIPQYGITNVLIVALSKCDDDEEYNNTFFNMQRILAYILLPMGVGIFLFRELAVKIVFGSGWEDAEFVIALWSVVSILRILLVSINSAIYISKGKPKISVYLQLLDMLILIPCCVIGVKYGLETFVIIRCIARLDIVIPSLIIISKVFKISIKRVIKNLAKPALLTAGMYVVGFFTKNLFDSLYWQIVSILICVLCYCVMFFIFAKDDMKHLRKMIKR
ncbi:MAG: lipopolysaccharide biosynthesis protein [Eubacteriales bacterium]